MYLTKRIMKIVMKMNLFLMKRVTEVMRKILTEITLAKKMMMTNHMKNLRKRW